ncbi:SnoaL-like domain-containing protein [Marilutibacter alkalisoli]|uniref:SnoaL-like domain-containing protein n=1 Tax=Marilutibacter alkalisoli TaxID=2591633 RepID=UPI001FC9E8CB|nr:SnoaL-like domain-containing protein [Lysobacter alkalisoli]
MRSASRWKARRATSPSASRACRRSAKGRQWGENIVEIHGGSVSDPVVADDWFSVAMGIDATYKDMGRVDMKEICVYQVRDGKIVREQFFYNPG